MARSTANYKVDGETPSKINQIAVQLGYIYGTGGWVGKMLDAIARGDLVIVKKEYLEKIRKGVDSKTG